MLENCVENNKLENPKNLIRMTGMNTPKLYDILNITENCAEILNNAKIKFSYVNDDDLMYINVGEKDYQKAKKILIDSGFEESISK